MSRKGHSAVDSAVSEYWYVNMSMLGVCWGQSQGRKEMAAISHHQNQKKRDQLEIT